MEYIMSCRRWSRSGPDGGSKLRRAATIEGSEFHGTILAITRLPILYLVLSYYIFAFFSFSNFPYFASNT